MNQYLIYENYKGDIEAVKQGWSWPGFFFTWIWALFKKMYGLGLGLFFVFLIFHILSEEDEVFDIIFGIVAIIISIYIGADGNRMRINNLKKRGFEMLQTVTAHNPEAAISEFMSSEFKNTFEGEYVCYKCNNPVMTDANYCPNCGNKFVCEKCGKKVLRSANYCRYCGTKFSGSQYSRKHNNAPPLDKDARRYGEALGLKGKVTIENIKQAYRQKIIKYHPDKVGHLGTEFQEIAERKTKEINEAYRYFRNKYNF